MILYQSNDTATPVAETSSVKYHRQEATASIYTVTIAILSMGKLGTIKEIFQLSVRHRKLYMFPIFILLIMMIGLTTLTSSGLAAFVYPI